MNDDGTYSKTIHLTEPGYYRFNFSDLQMVDLVLDKSNIELNVDGNDQSGALEIKGSPDYRASPQCTRATAGFSIEARCTADRSSVQEAGKKKPGGPR